MPRKKKVVESIEKCEANCQCAEPSQIPSRPREDKNPIQEEQVKADEDFQVGYMVGVKNDGSFFFRPFGNKQGLTSLLGIHRFATISVEAQEDRVLGTGDALIHELANILGSLNQKLDVVVAKLTAPKDKL